MPEKAQNLETIADKASELFVRRGYSNTTLAEIGKQCIGSADGIKNHFETKENLLLYILERLKSDLRSYVFSIADDENETELQRLRKINNFLKDYFLTKKACLVAVMGMESDIISEDARKIMHDIFEDWRQTYTKLFKSHFSPYLAKIHATNSIIFIEGAIIWMRITQEEEPLKRVFNNIEQQLLKTDVS